tara:strand:- start:389 stop:727 length:339 start_codon:yes stop_codon:yes gene_type:complete
MANTFKLKTGASVGTSLETVYTVPAATTAVMIGAMMANKSASAITVDVQIVTASSAGENADDVYIIKSVSIPTGGTLEAIEGKVVLETGDIVKALASVTAALDVALSVMEIT